MTFKLPPYLQWRNGRPRWEPGPRLRPAFHGQDLRDEHGDFLRLEAAIARAKQINADVAAWKAGGIKKRAEKLNRKPARTCNALWELWASPADPSKAAPRFQNLAEITRRDYTWKIGVFLDEFGDEPFAAINKADMHTWWENLYRERGHSMANGTVACVRAMFSYGVMKNWRADNPAKSLGLLKVPPRVVVWTPSEAELYVELCDVMGFSGLGDAIVIALHTGQRQSDVLRLEEPQIANGRAKILQGKRKARVSVPYTPALEARFAAIRERHRAGNVVTLQSSGPIVRDRNGGRYTKERFGADFRLIRAYAADILPEIAGKQFLDLRDTAITRLAIAGCTVPEIRSITGHSLDTIHKVLEHYLALDDRMADAAIDRLKIWMAEEGIAI